MKIILASSSPYRIHQLKQLGLQFESRKPEIDEESEKEKFFKQVDESRSHNYSSNHSSMKLPQKLALHLSALKADSLLINPDEIIIAGDQLVHLQGKILGKP